MARGRPLSKAVIRQYLRRAEQQRVAYQCPTAAHGRREAERLRYPAISLLIGRIRRIGINRPHFRLQALIAVHWDRLYDVQIPQNRCPYGRTVAEGLRISQTHEHAGDVLAFPKAATGPLLPHFGPNPGASFRDLPASPTHSLPRANMDDHPGSYLPRKGQRQAALCTSGSSGNKTAGYAGVRVVPRDINASTYCPTFRTCAFKRGPSSACAAVGEWRPGAFVRRPRSTPHSGTEVGRGRHGTRVRRRQR